MTREPKWLPASLTFGPGFMLLGLLHVRVGPMMSWFDGLNFAAAGAGTLMLVRGLVVLLVTSRASANEIAALANS